MSMSERMRDFPDRAEELAELLRDLRDRLDRSLGQLDPVADRLGPEAERLELRDEVAIDLEELAGEGLALEQVRDLGLDALVAPDDGGDGGRRGDRDQERVPQTRAR